MDAELKLFEILKRDAKDLTLVRQDVKTIHNAGNIRASGDEAEIAVRNLLRDRLPEAYKISHGHIVDENWNCSPQLDIIISNNLGAPVLFKTKSGAEYIPYESVYAIGEIKSTYYKSKGKDKDSAKDEDGPISEFINTIADLKKRLKRKETPVKYFGSPIGTGWHLGDNLNFYSDFSKTEKRTYQNPLFSFMFFVSSGDFNFSEVQATYRGDIKILPSLVCFLDRGFISYTHIDKSSRPVDWGIFPVPEFALAPAGHENHWNFIQPVPWEKGKKAPEKEEMDREEISGEVIGFLYAILMVHLQRCLLSSPQYISYAQKAFKLDKLLDYIE